jgi:putative ABC transport system substrate-binding protein
VIGRRQFLRTSAALLVAPLEAVAQGPARTYRVGVLSDLPPSEAFGAFERRLTELGYIAGTNLVFDHRRAEGHVERLPALATELVRLQPDIIVSTGGQDSVRALKRATATIPVIFGAVEWDPIATGIVASLDRPGGNFTGLALLATELAAKRLELLREALPRATRVAVLWQRIRAESQLKAVQEAAGSLKIQVVSLEVRNIPGDLDEAIRGALQQRAEALLVLGSPAFYPERKRLADLALKHRLPASFQRPAYADAGGLMAFGADIDGMFRRMAEYADRILKGAKPGDLPIEQPAKFELVVNLKTARALGLTFPPALLARADRVIE